MPDPKDVGSEQTKAAGPAPLRFVNALDTSVKLIAAILALIIPSIAAFFAFTYAVGELKRDTETQTCELAIKIGIATAINEYQELIEKEKHLPPPPLAETDDQKKEREAEVAKLDTAKKRAQKKRALYEAAEKNVWKRNCAEIERQALDLLKE